MLPADRQIVVYCYTGQTASQVTSVLNVLGYDAYNMLFGMQAWTMDQDVRAKFFNAETQSFDYPFEGSVAAVTAEPPAEPETLPATGGLGLPLEGILIGFGALTATAGMALRRRKAA